jgi:hypothetical protein
MKHLIEAAIFLVLFGLFGYICYRRGYSNAQRDEFADADADLRGDGPVRDQWHSTSYFRGYHQGIVFGSTEAGVKAINECGQRLAWLGVTAGNDRAAKAMGKLLVEGYVLPSQLRAATEGKVAGTSPD